MIYFSFPFKIPNFSNCCINRSGYGLCAIVEVLTAISANASFGTNVREWKIDGSSSVEANFGQVFIAVDPACFAPDFEGRLSELNDMLRNLPVVGVNIMDLLFYLSLKSILISFELLIHSSICNHCQVDENKKVLVPGDPERAHMKKVDEEGGVRYHPNQLKSCDHLAATLNVRQIGSRDH